MGLQISWGKVDTQAKPNSSPTMVDSQPFSNIELLKVEETLVETKDYATVGELNQTLLDNSQEPIQESPNPDNIVLWSKSISDSNGYFKSNPILDVSFSDVVTSTGITLYFWNHNNEYCREIKIRWYDVDDVLMDEQTFYPDKYEYSCSNYIEQYKRVEIEFIRTTLPGRFVKMYGIQYGEKVKLSAKDIVNASLIESVGITSTQLFTNQLECDIISLDNNFNIITNPGSYLGIQINQQLEVKSDTKEYGNYFINQSKVTGNIINIVANDLIGYLESQEFTGGLYSEVTFEFILNQIKNEAQLSNVFGGEHTGFEVPTTILNKIMSGYIPYTNCREALHQLCYAANVLANCNRTDKIIIYELDNSTTKDIIDNSKLIMDTLSVEENELFTGVSLNAFSYKQEIESKELENKEYEIGTHTITFSEPHFDYTITGATIIKSGANYVNFEVTTDGTVVINGYSYEEIKQLFTATNPNYTGNTPSIKQISDVKLVNPSNAQLVAENKLSLYLMKYKLTADIYDLQADIGSFVEIENASGYIQQIETNLLTEDVCSLEVLGNAKTNN